MKVVNCDREIENMTLTGKVMGVFESRERLDAFRDAASLRETDEVEVFEGRDGLQCLKQFSESVEGFLDALLGDMESGMLKVFMQAVERGAVVFAVPVESNERDELVRVAVQHGAKHLAHFGQLVNESFEHLTGDQPA